VQNEGANLNASVAAWISRAGRGSGGLTWKGVHTTGQRDCMRRGRGEPMDAQRRCCRIGAELVDF